MRTRAPTRRRDRDAIVCFALGVLLLGSAVWMLVAPLGWYSGVPADVPDFGPYNEHFVRDIGCAYLASAIALLWGAAQPSRRLPLLAIVAVFLGAHGVLHVFDTSRGFVDPHHWWIDFPGVYLPALIVVVLAWRARRA